MQNSDIVKSMLFSSIDEVSANPELFAVNPGKDFTRNRKLGFGNLIQMLLTMEADCVKEELYRFFDRSPDTPSKTAFYKQRNKLAGNALPNLLYTFNSKLSSNLYNGKYQLIAADGSAADYYRDPNDSDSYFEPNGKSNLGYNQIHINAFYSLLDKRFTNLIIQPARKRNEYKAFCDMVDAAGSAGAPTIYFADMGYTSYNDFAHVIEQNQYFLIRCNDTRLQRILGCSVDHLGKMDCWVHRILTRSNSVKKRTRQELSDQYRYICKAVPLDYLDDDQTEYDIDLRIVRFELSNGCFENIITNLPEQEFGLEDFIDLYHLRWGIETSYRNLKYPLCLNEFHSKKYDYIVQEVWARVILHNFSSAIIAGVKIEQKSTKFEYQVNFSEAFKICRDFLRLHDPGKTIEVERLIASNIEAIRPGRTFARQHRFHLPFRFCYRN